MPNTAAASYCVLSCNAVRVIERKSLGRVAVVQGTYNAAVLATDSAVCGCIGWCYRKDNPNLGTKIKQLKEETQIKQRLLSYILFSWHSLALRSIGSIIAISRQRCIHTNPSRVEG